MAVIAAGLFLILSAIQQQAGLYVMVFGFALSGLGAFKGRKGIRTEFIDEKHSVDATRILDMAGKIAPGSYSRVMEEGRQMRAAFRKKPVSRQKHKCPKCEELVARISKFCDHCGLKIRNECLKCGILNKPLARFCLGCGKKMA